MTYTIGYVKKVVKRATVVSVQLQPIRYRYTNNKHIVQKHDPLKQNHAQWLQILRY